MSDSRTVSLFRNGRNQAVRIPVDFELPGDQAVMRKEGEKLVIEPKHSGRTLVQFLDEMEPCPDFPEIDDTDLPPLRDVDLK